MFGTIWLQAASEVTELVFFPLFNTMVLWILVD